MSWRTAVGALLALLIFELLLRHLSWGHETIDPALAWVWRDATVVHRLNEGWGESHWSDDGSRRVPILTPEQPRVLLLGDSFTEALQVDDDVVYSARLGLRAINAGHSARSPADYVSMAAEYARRYRPDWTIVQLGSDDFGADAFDSTKTHFDDALQVHVVPPHLGTWSRRLSLIRERSAVLDYGIGRWSMYRASAHMPPLFRAADLDSSIAAAHVDAPIWPVEQEMALLSRAYNGRITFFFIPKWQSADSIEDRMRAACIGISYSCVNFRDAFPEFEKRGASPFGFSNSRFGRGHMNEDGHSAAAALLRSEMARLRARGLF